MKRNIVLLTALLGLTSVGTLVTSGCAGTRLSKSTGEYIDDAAITAKIKAAFVQDPVVSALGVNVDTFKGTVQLNGFVDLPEQKTRAEQIARSVPGVANVQNRISIKGQTPAAQPAR